MDGKETLQSVLYFSTAVFILVNLFWLAGASGCF